MWTNVNCREHAGKTINRAVIHLVIIMSLGFKVKRRVLSLFTLRQSAIFINFNMSGVKRKSNMGEDSYQIKAICKRCNMPISYRIDRIKEHLLNCRGKNDSHEIVSLVRYWDNGKKDGKEFNKSYRDESDSVTTSSDKDSGYEKPHTNYMVKIL